MVTDKSRGILYFNHGTKHLARLVASLYSLRNVARSTLPVCLLDTQDSPASREIVARIATDPRLQPIELKPIRIEMRRKNSCYVAKAGLWRHTPFDQTMMIDSDTVVAKEPSGIFEELEKHEQLTESGGFVCTQFSSWKSNHKPVNKRVSRWLDVDWNWRNDIPGLAWRLAQTNLHGSIEAVNTGVLAFSRGAEFLEPWESLSAAGWRTPFTDELACQLLMAAFPHSVLDDRWNHSPLYGTRRNDPSSVIIWHFHGNKQCRPEALPIWWPIFMQCVNKKLAGINEWLPAGDERLGAYIASQGVCA